VCRCSAGEHNAPGAVSVTIDAYRQSGGGTIFYDSFISPSWNGLSLTARGRECWLSVAGWLPRGRWGGHPHLPFILSSRAVDSAGKLAERFTQIQCGHGVERIGELLEEPMRSATLAECPAAALLPSFRPGALQRRRGW